MRKILLLLSVILFSCRMCIKKIIPKKQLKFEEAGLYDDAAEYYYQAVKKKEFECRGQIRVTKNRTNNA